MLCMRSSRSRYTVTVRVHPVCTLTMLQVLTPATHLLLSGQDSDRGAPAVVVMYRLLCALK